MKTKSYFLLFLFSVALARATALASQTTNLSHYESDHDSLPSYTLVSGLPSYDDALEQMKTKITRPTNCQSKRPSLTRLFHFEHEKSNLEITNYLAPKYEDAAATSAPSYEVSVILPQKTASEKAAKPAYTSMQPITDYPPPTSHHHHNYHQVYSSSEADSFIVSLPPETTSTRSVVIMQSRNKSHSMKSPPLAANESLTPELNESRKGDAPSTAAAVAALKVKANSVGNLCDIHR